MNRACLLGAVSGAAISMSLALAPMTAMAQETPGASRAAAIAFDIPAQDLNSAILAFADRAGVQVIYNTARVRGLRSAAVRGTMAPDEALRQLLIGTGLGFEFTGATTVNLVTAAASDGSVALDIVTVTADLRDREWAGGGIYRTPGPVSHISGETIERYRGTTPGDVFKGTPGVLSGENRNSAAIDPNVRGMQGMGRVAVTIDGAMNATTTYRGYQGVGNRTYIDPDLLSSVNIERGPSTGLGGSAGTISMQTLSADDLVRDGNLFGLRVKATAITNTSGVPARSTGNGIVYERTSPIDTSSPFGMDRPSLLETTAGNGSIALGFKSGNIDLVAAWARRRTGNYHAGEDGPVAQGSGNIGPVVVCPIPINCTLRPTWYVNEGLTAYRAGEQVLNTSIDTETTLLKGTVRFDGGHALELGTTLFEGANGEIMPSSASTKVTAGNQRYLTETTMRSHTARYRFKPDDDGLVDLRWNTWFTALEVVGARVAFGSPGLVGSNSTMWGSDISNTTVLGDVTLGYGISYLDESTGPTSLTRQVETYMPRDGTRDETRLFATVDWAATDWLTLQGGLRYQFYNSQDRAKPNPIQAAFGVTDTSHSGEGFSPSVGLVATPFPGGQVYARYRESVRMPALMETTGAFNLYVAPDLDPERSKVWEIGVNYEHTGLIDSDDHSGVKLSYFDNTVDDYISRRNDGYLLFLGNIEKARFSGIELSGSYSIDGFTLDISGTYYTNVEFCPADTGCISSTLTADYANNHVPPEYSGSLSVSQQLFDDMLTLGGRVTYVGPRAASAQPYIFGAAPLVAPIIWDPYTTVDAFVDFTVTENLTLNIAGENLTDAYYVDPLSLGLIPAPGRTLRFGMTVAF